MWASFLLTFYFQMYSKIPPKNETYLGLVDAAWDSL